MVLKMVDQVLAKWFRQLVSLWLIAVFSAPLAGRVPDGHVLLIATLVTFGFFLVLLFLKSRGWLEEAF